MAKNFTLDLKEKKSGGAWWKIPSVILTAAVFTVAGIKAADEFGAKSVAEKANESSICPPEMVFVTSASGGFCIDRYEASVGSDCPVADPSGQVDTGSNLNERACLPASEAGKKPWRNISQNQAALACAKAGKRLPTNGEWQQAALGTPDKKEGWGADDCLVDRNWPDIPGLTGSAAGCVSGAGAFDMVGNVWEWVEGSVIEGEFNGRVLPESGYVAGVSGDALPSDTRKDSADDNYYGDYFWVKKKDNRVIARGGYWENKSDAGQYSAYAVPEPSFAGDGIGFRCAR